MSSRVQSAPPQRFCRTLICAATLLLTVLASLDPLLLRFPQFATLIPEPLRVWATSPAHELRAAQRALRDGRPASAAIATAWRKAPWFSSVWLMAGLDAARIAPDAALPWYAEALRLDPWGPSVARVAVPALLRAGWIDTATALDRGRRFNVGAVFAALPTTPPADWPLPWAAGDALAAEQLRRHHRTAWLRAIVVAGQFADASVEVRREILLGLCAAGDAACLPLVRACLAGASPCEGGTRFDAPLLEVALDAALHSGDRELLQELAAQARPLARDRRLVLLTVRALQSLGREEEAVRLRRLHPALLE